MDGLGEVLDVLGRDTGDRDTAILGEVDVVLVLHLLDLLGGQASVAEHADLVGDVVPVELGLVVVDEVALELGAHGDDAIGHQLDLLEPLGIQLGGVEDSGDNAGTVDGGVRVHGADNNLDLRVDASLLLGRGSDEGEGTGTLTVETHVLGEGLGESNQVTVLDELAEGIGILVSGARGETLVGHVEEGKVTSILDNLGELVPLSLGGVDTSGVVGTSVHQDDGSLRGVLYDWEGDIVSKRRARANSVIILTKKSNMQILMTHLDVVDHALKVEAVGLLVKVLVVVDLKARVLENWDVVAPSGGGDKDLLAGGEPLGKELSSDTESTGSGNGLGDGDLYYQQTIKS